MEGRVVGHKFEMGLPKDYPCQVWLNLFSGFKGKDLNVIFYQNMSNLYNQYKSVEKKKFTEKPRIYVNLLIVM